MKTWGNSGVAEWAASQSWPEAQQGVFRPCHLHLVTRHEVEELRQALVRGALPPDLEEKLARLAKGDLRQRFVAQHCRTIIALLQASQEGSFNAATPEACEWLLRVLAYVRKDDDAVPDYKPGGFADDQEEVRAATVELASLLQAFKAWRLSNQVPAMWRS